MNGTEIISTSYFGSVDRSGQMMTGDTVGEAQDKLVVAIDGLFADLAERLPKMINISSDALAAKVEARAQSVIRNIIGNDGRFVHINPNNTDDRTYGSAQSRDIVKAIVTESRRILSIVKFASRN